MSVGQPDIIQHLANLISFKSWASPLSRWIFVYEWLKNFWKQEHCEACLYAADLNANPGSEELKLNQIFFHFEFDDQSLKKPPFEN